MRTKGFFSWFSILFFSACIAFSLFQWFSSRSPEITLIQGLRQCAQNVSGDTQLVACTREIVATQLQTHSTAELMSELSTSSIPKLYYGCHGVAHIIGQETYDKYGDVEKAISKCTDDCYSGCLHGVMASAVKAEYGANDPGVDIAHMDLQQIETIGVKYCSNSALCHGMGHVLYFVTNDFQKSSQGCDAISRHISHEVCLLGVFMQGVGGLHDSLVMGTLPPPTANVTGDYDYPCDTVSPQYQRGCFLYLPRYQDIAFEQEKITDRLVKFKIAKDNCETQTGSARSYCFEGIGQYALNYVSVKNGDYITPVAHLCMNLPTLSDQKSCVLGFTTVQRGYEYNDQAYNFCPLLGSEDMQTFCYFSDFSFFGRTTPTLETFCSYGDSKDTCIKAYSTYMTKRATLPDYRFGLYGESL